MTVTAVTPELANRVHRTLEPLHAVAYFSPEVFEGWKSLGLHPQLGYFPGRSAAMGAVNPGVTVATFYVFAPRLVELALPAAWATTTPEAVVETRFRTVLATLERTVGRLDGLDEAVQLARTATEALTPEGRPLYAAHAALPWPEDPLLGLWFAQTLLREHRGDGHVAALTNAGLDPVEALLTYGLTSGATPFLKLTRGWTEDEWAAAAVRLEGRGLLLDGALTPEGTALREAVEDQTQRSAMAGWDHLGSERSERLLALVRPMRDALAASGLFPPSVLPPPKA